MRALRLLAAMTWMLLAFSTPALAEDRGYVVYGDSIAYGSESYLPYVWLYDWQESVDLGYTVPFHNFAQPGTGSADVRALLDQPSYQAWDKQARFISVGIGFNDLNAQQTQHYGNGTCGGVDGQDCYRTAVANFKTNWDAIVKDVASSCSPSGTQVIILNAYQPHNKEEIGQQSNLNASGLDNQQVYALYLSQMNDYMKQSANAHGWNYVDVRTLFNGAGKEDPVDKGWITTSNTGGWPYWVHPNMLGDTAIDEAMRGLPATPNCYS